MSSSVARDPSSESSESRGAPSTRIEQLGVAASCRSRSMIIFPDAEERMELAARCACAACANAAARTERVVLGVAGGPPVRLQDIMARSPET